MTLRAIAGLLLLTAATHATAQFYKYVGPDGKVTYSDNPPVEPAKNVQKFRAGVPRAVTYDAPAPAATDAAAAPAPRRAAPQQASANPKEPAASASATASAAASAPAAEPAAPAATVAADLTPLQPGLRVSLETATLIERSVDFCILNVPSAYRRYVSAEEAWKGRNGPVVTQMRAVMAGLMHEDERLRAEQAALEWAARQLHPVRAAMASQRAGWCDRMIDDMGTGRFDLANIAEVRTLMQYRPR